MSTFWPRFVKEGDFLYDYLINNFNKLLDNDKIIHFYIRDGIYYGIDNTERIKENYGNDIEKELVIWIKKEYQENCLFNRDFWKPFRDQETLSDMYNGYRKLFQYKEYYFQLAMESECGDYNCKYCKEYQINSIEPIITPLFCLTLYGWKNKDSEMLQPYKHTIIPIDNLMCDLDWNTQ
jgi:hypothetical protein